MNLKFRIKNKTVSRKLQELLFEAGGNWKGDTKPIVQLCEMEYLFITDGNISCASSAGSDYFNKHDGRELSTELLEALFPHKETITIGGIKYDTDAVEEALKDLKAV